jgi:butyryl-CoA dehydrogenase
MPDSISPHGDTLIIDMARRFSQHRLAPLAAEREKPRRIEPEIVAELSELGLFGATTSAEWDGNEIDTVTYALLLEEIAAGDGSISTMVSVHNSPTCIVVNSYDDAQKGRWLRKLATGEHVGSFGLTEPQDVSDASNLKTRAVKKGDRHIVNGAKQFISEAGNSGGLAFFAATDHGAGSAFVIEKDQPGLAVTRIEENLGQKASDTCGPDLREDMEVPEDQRIGAEGEGYRIALFTLESGRIGIAAQSIGMAQAALGYAVLYARDRKAFGCAIVDIQAVGFRLADAKTRLEAAAPVDAVCRPPDGGGSPGAGGRLHG